MIKRAGRWLLVTMLVLLIAVGGTYYWLLHTAPGASWLWSRAEQALPGRLAATAVSGTLAGGFELRGFSYTDAAQAVQISRVRLAVNPDFFPLRLTVDSLVVDDVLVIVREADTVDDDEPISVRALLASLRLPIPVHADEFALRNLTLETPGGSRELLSTLELAGTLHKRLTIERLEAVRPDARVRLNADIELSEPFAVQAESDVEFAFDGVTGDEPLFAEMRIDGNLDDLRIDVQSPTHGFSAGADVAAIESNAVISLGLSAPRLSWPLLDEQAPYALEDIAVSIDGRPTDYTLELSADLVTETLARTHLTARAGGNLDGLDVHALEATSDELALELAGELRWADGITTDAVVEIERLDPERWIAGWPRSSPVSGRLAGSYSDQRLILDQFELRQLNAPGHVEGAATFDPANNVVDGTLSWRDLQWPLAPAAARIESQDGTLQVSGRPDQWVASGDISVGTPELPEGRFRVSATGDLDHAALRIADSDVLAGNVTGEARIAWGGTGEWSATLDARDIVITPLLPDWPGRLSAEFTARGQREPFRLDLDIARLNGDIRARDVSAAGRLRIDDAGMMANDLVIQSGDSVLELDGSFRESPGMTFSAAVTDLSDFLPGATGSLTANGRVAPAAGLPHLQIELDGSDVGYLDATVKSLSIRNTPSEQNPLGIEIRASQLEAAGREFETLLASLSGSLEQHEFALDTGTGGLQAKLVIAGELDGMPADADAEWRGQLRTMDLRHSDLMAASLRVPSLLRFSRASATLGRFCLDSEGDTSLCASGSWAQDGRFASAMQMTSLPLDWLRIAFVSDLEFTQTVNGTVQFAKAATGPVSGSGRLDLSPGQIRNEFDERLNMTTRAGFLSFALSDGQLLSGELSLPFSQTAEIAGSFNVLDLAQGADSEVRGNLTAKVNDIGVVANIAPAIDEATGALGADLQIDGTVAAPRFAGKASLRDGRIVYDALGLNLDDIQLDGTIGDGNQLELHSTFRAGEGSGEIKANGDYRQGRAGTLNITFDGQDLTLVDLPDLLVKADADLRVGLQGENVSIDGRVTVPEARLSSVNLAATTVTESSDVTFVGERVPESVDEASPASEYAFNGTVALELGDSVRIDLDVAEARLTGKTSLTWNGPLLPTASGAFDVAGKVQAYGQLLEITEGNIRFPGVPVTDPELRIRAERDIFGNSQVRRAGVLVTGSATSPTLEVYTTPATNEDRALTLLVTGSDFNFEQGVGAVDVGTYIAPRVYISYGLGLFDTGNVISVRYDLARGFGIKATSGQSADGVDLSYTIEH
ncbi:MAG: translocation/assembly module TamB domain-containing protein [Woeseia sp.]